MPTYTFTEGADQYTASTDEELELYFLGGDDTLTVDQQNDTDQYYEAYMGTGNDRVRVLNVSGYVEVEGNDGNDRLDFYSANLNGGTDFYAGVGNDSVNVYAGAANLYADGEGGADTFRIGGNVHNVFLDGGLGDDSFAGNGYSATSDWWDEDYTSYVDGGAGNDRFTDFGTGWTLYGGSGDDVYRVKHTLLEDGTYTYTDIVEYYGDGVDRVAIAVGADYILPENVEHVYVQSFQTVDLSATIWGNDLANRIDGSKADETMYGGWGDDILIGRGGDDTLYGGEDNDTYYVDSDGDLTIEGEGQGIDTVRVDLRSEVNLTNGTTVDDVATYQLQANIENLTAGSDIMHILSGNALDNQITGRALADVIRGFAGDDTLKGGGGDDTLGGGIGNDVLFGGAGNDLLYGDEGNDILQGNTGDDEMRGGAGDDIYVVDSAGDLVIDAEGEGNDTVHVYSSSYTLSNNIENADGFGASVTLIGNSLDNVLTGTDGADILQDTADGEDTFQGDAGADIIASEADGLVDTFVYNAVSDSIASAYDRVFGVEGGAGGDLFDLSGVDAIASTETDDAFTYIGNDAFSGTAGELRVDGDFIYGDVNGDGVADLVIEFDTGVGSNLDLNNFIF